MVVYEAGSTLPAGIYLLKVMEGEKVIGVEKVVV